MLNPATLPENANPNDPELRRWRETFAGDEYFYGDEPGPVARRAARYHRPLMAEGATALDAGCGEGQDLAFLAESGYVATGTDFTPEGIAKSGRLLASRGLQAEVIAADLRVWTPPRTYDLVIAVNALQFLGADSPAVLQKLQNATACCGVFGFSGFARETHEPLLTATVYRWTADELMAAFAGWQFLETARLWQWRADGSAQPFLTLIARRSS